jgi:hypothetical protein
LLNRGRIDEDEAGIQVEIPELGVVERSPLVDIDEDDEASASVTFSIEERVKPGTYAVRVFSVYDVTTKNNFKDLSFTVEDCDQSTTPTPVVTPPPVVAPPVVTQPPVVVTPPTTPPVTTTPVTPTVPNTVGTSSTAPSYTWALVAGIIVVAALIVFLAVRFAKQ